MIASGGDGEKDWQQEAIDEGNRHAPVEEKCTLATDEAVGAVVQPLDPSTTVEGVVISGGSFNGARSSGAGGGGAGPSGSPLRDSAKGKGVVETGESKEALTGPVEFRPAAGSSGHEPIS